MKVIKILVAGLLSVSLLATTSCSKDGKKKIRIKENITPIKADMNEKFKIEGLKTDYILIGGKWFDVDDPIENTGLYPFPMAIEGSDNIYLRTGVKYKNEFYVLTRKLKQKAECITQDYYGAIKTSTFDAGKTITFIWSTKDEFKGWYKWFEIFDYVDPVKNGDTLKIMVIAENTTRDKIQNTDGVRGKVRGLFVGGSEPVEITRPDAEEGKILVFEPKQRIALCEDIIYKGPGKYKIKNAVFEKDVIIDELELNSENLGIK